MQVMSLKREDHLPKNTIELVERRCQYIEKCTYVCNLSELFTCFEEKHPTVEIFFLKV